MNYSVNAKSGYFVDASDKAVLTIQPENNQIGLELNTLN